MRAAVALICATMFLGCSVFGSEANPRMTDAQYIAIARSAPPAQAFFAKYGAADASVDRSGRLAVDFRTSGSRLRVFIENDRVADAFVECPPGAVHTGEVIVAIRACP